MSKDNRMSTTEIMMAAECCYNTALKFMKKAGIEFKRGERAMVDARDGVSIVKAIKAAQVAKMAKSFKSKKK